MTRYYLKIDTYWCGEYQEYAFETDKSLNELSNYFEMLAHDNFTDFDGIEGVCQELFPDWEEDSYTDEQIEAAEEVAHEYYSFFTDKFDDDNTYDGSDFEDYDYLNI